MVVQTWGQRWSGDYWAHRAAVLELSHHPWNPAHPYTGSAAPDPELSPYALALGLAARVTPLGVRDVLSIAALINLALFLLGLRRFVGRFSQAPLAPFWTLLAMLFLWGWAPWRWSGYLSANSIGFGLPYPSMFATALLLIALSALIDFCDGRGKYRLAVLVVLSPLIILTHPFTGAALSLAGFAILISRFGAMSASKVAALAGGACAVAVAILAWPLYPALDLLSVSTEYDSVHAVLYRLVGQRLVLALIASPVLALRLRADHRDPLALMASSATAIFVLGGITERYSLGRILPLVMLALHVAVGVWLAERAPALWQQGTGPRRWMAAGAGGVILATGVVGCQAGLVRAMPGFLLPSRVVRDPRLEADDGGLSFLARQTSPDDVAFVRTRQAKRVSPAFGAKVVAPGYVAPFLKDARRREADVTSFFASQSTDERRSLMQRYGVSFVLFDLRFDTVDTALGTVVYRDGLYVLVAVDRSG